MKTKVPWFSLFLVAAIDVACSLFLVSAWSNWESGVAKMSSLAFLFLIILITVTAFYFYGKEQGRWVRSGTILNIHGEWDDSGEGREGWDFDSDPREFHPCSPVYSVEASLPFHGSFIHILRNRAYRSFDIGAMRVVFYGYEELRGEVRLAADKYDRVTIVPVEQRSASS